MIERLIKSILGITLSLVIALGGWLITNHFIETNAQSFFVPRYVARVAIPEYGNLDQEGIRDNLSPSEVYSVFQSWCPSNPIIFHEPASDQIGLEEAVTIGRQNLDILKDLLHLPEDFFVSTFMNIHIAQRGAFDSGEGEWGQGELRDSIYSYWQLNFSSDSFNVVMKLNAFTGQMWSATLFIMDRNNLIYRDEYETIVLLEELTSLLLEQAGIEGGEINISILEYTANARILPRDNMPGTTVSINYVEMPDMDGVRVIRDFHISLLTKVNVVDLEGMEDNFTTYEQ